MKEFKTCEVHSVEQLAECHIHSLATQREQEVGGQQRLASPSACSLSTKEVVYTSTVRRAQLLLQQNAFSQQSWRQYIHALLPIQFATCYGGGATAVGVSQVQSSCISN